MLFISCFNQTSDEETAQTDQVAASTEWVEDVGGTTDYSQIVSSTILVEKKPLRSELYASGTVSGQHEAIVKANTAGTIESIDFDLGKAVEQGDALVHLNNTIASLSFDQVEKQVENSRSQLEANEQLYKRGAISLSQLNASKSALNGLEVQLKRAKEGLNDVVISSPIKGRIAEKDASLVIGDSVRVGQVIARVIDVENFVLFSVLDSHKCFLLKKV